MAAGLAAAGLAPSLPWQSRSGWPQLTMARSIADGGSGTSTERWTFPLLLPTLTGATFLVVVVGAVVLWRRQPSRWLPVAAGLLVVVLVAVGGKPYYAFAFVPVLAAAGVGTLRRWHAGRLDGGKLLRRLVVLNAVGGAFVGLPVLPAAQAPVAVVYDHGEQVGWPELADTVARAARATGADLVLTENYGQAGAVDQARRTGRPMPPVASGHNGYWWWSRPTATPHRGHGGMERRPAVGELVSRVSSARRGVQRRRRRQRRGRAARPGVHRSHPPVGRAVALDQTSRMRASWGERGLPPPAFVLAASGRCRTSRSVDGGVAIDAGGADDQPP